MLSSVLNIINEHNYKLSSFRNDSKKIFTLTLEKINQYQKSLSVVFCDEKKITILNKKHRQLKKKSDVLSFPSDTKLTPNYLGDIVICYPVAVAQAIEYEHSLRRELSFLFLHGLLHLLGYDHIKLEDEMLMFALQEEILNTLGITRGSCCLVQNKG